jgi:hypothetical protein
MTMQGRSGKKQWLPFLRWDIQRVSQILPPVETCGHTSDFGIFKKITNKLSEKNFESAIKTCGIYISFV